jgi:L-fucose isomerase-like protein
MFRNYGVTIGIAPVRRDKFPDPKEAFKNKQRIMLKLKEIFGSIHDVKIVDIDWLNKEGMFFETEDVAKIEAYFRKEGVDAVFVPHCNFGQEEVVGKLGKALGKPFLLWGPRDDSPPPNFGWRLTDSQCGLFASGKALLRYGVPFTYIENCWLDSPLLKAEIEKFVRVVSVMKDFNGMRVGQISLRPRQFHSVMVNEDELLEKFNIEVVPINETEIMAAFNKYYTKKNDDLKQIVSETTCALDCHTEKPEDIDKMAALELAIMDLAKLYGLKALASECWTVFRTNIGFSPCFALGDLSEKGLPVACETDIHGAITSAILAAAARGETSNFLADVTIRHPTNDNAELLWHCGPFPKSLARDYKKRVLTEAHGQYELKGGDVTIARFDAIGGKYSLFAGEAVGTEGPSTQGNYLWIETKDWPKWERKLVCGPYVHHVACVHGKYLPILDEACKYIGNIERDFV